MFCLVLSFTILVCFSIPRPLVKIIYDDTLVILQVAVTKHNIYFITFLCCSEHFTSRPFNWFWGFLFCFFPRAEKWVMSPQPYNFLSSFPSLGTSVRSLNVFIRSLLRSSSWFNGCELNCMFGFCFAVLGEHVTLGETSELLATISVGYIMALVLMQPVTFQSLNHVHWLWREDKGDKGDHIKKATWLTKDMTVLKMESTSIMRYSSNQ